MDVHLVRDGFRRAIAASHNPAKRRVLLQPRRLYATHQEEFRAASPIAFTDDVNQFAPVTRQMMNRGGQGGGGGGSQGSRFSQSLLRRVRVLPASPSYFTGTPQYMDDLLYLAMLLRKYQLLPKAAQGEAPVVAWKKIDQYRTELAEPVREKGYASLVSILKRLNKIHPSLMPVEVERAMRRYKRLVQPADNRAKPIEIDEWGRARALGHRKSSHAQVWLVEGEGECLINGKTLTQYFGQMKDRDAALFPLKVTQRLDKYNVWAIARGGGTTGQAEAITLGVAKALVAHEPDLKRALRQAGVLTRDKRIVERKKPGHLKARKMPGWVKR